MCVLLDLFFECVAPMDVVRTKKQLPNLLSSEEGQPPMFLVNYRRTGECQAILATVTEYNLK